MGLLASQFDIADASAEGQHDPDRRNRAKAAIADAIATAGASSDLAGPALQEAVGLGILDAYINDEGIHALVIDSPTRVRLDRGNGLEDAEGSFSSARALTIVGRRLLARGGHDSSTAIGTVDLPGGATATVMLPPIAASGTVIELHRATSTDAPGLVARGVLNDAIVGTLSAAVQRGLGIVVVGSAEGTRTVLGALTTMTSENERVVAVNAPHVSGRPRVSLTTGQGTTIAELLRATGSMRCQRRVVDGVGAGDLFGVVGAASAVGHTFVGVNGAGASTLELGVGLGGVPKDAAFGFLGSAFRVMVIVGAVGSDVRVTELHELHDGASTRLFHWNGSDFAHEASLRDD